MDNLIRKEFVAETKVVSADDQTLTLAISTEDRDRDGETISVAGWDLKAYRKNPVVLFAHQYNQPPVGKALKTWVDKDARKLMSTMQFAPTPFGQELWLLYSQGFMRTASVGFIPREWEEAEESDGEGLGFFGKPRNYKKQELLEFSLVPVPSNPNALVSLMAKSVSAEAKGAISYGSAHANGTPKAPEDAEWDANAEMTRAEGKGQYRRMCAWVDPDLDPDTRQAYKLPHHRADGTLVWRGVAAAGAVLMGARGGADIPDPDVGGCKAHLGRHYDEFDKTPPWEGKAMDTDNVSKPYPDEHACRLRDPGDFQDDSFRRVQREHEGKKYSVIMGRLTGETTMTEQAYRYAKDVWQASEARSHCRDHDGTFEAAEEGRGKAISQEQLGDDLGWVLDAVRQVGLAQEHYVLAGELVGALIAATGTDNDVDGDDTAEDIDDETITLLREIHAAVVKRSEPEPEGDDEALDTETLRELVRDAVRHQLGGSHG